MKKFTKGCLVISLVMFFLAIGCFVTAFIVGENPITTVKNVVTALESGLGDYTSEFDEGYQMEDFELLAEFDEATVNDVELQMGAGTVVVKCVTGDACRVWMDDRDAPDEYEVEAYEEDGGLHVVDSYYNQIDIEDLFSDSSFSGHSLKALLKGDLKELLKGNLQNQTGVKIVIELPKKQMHTFKADLQLGAMKLYDVTAMEMNLQSAAGAIYGEGCISGNEVTVNVGMGEAKVNKLQCDNADFRVGMGNAEISTIDTKQLNVAVDMGNLDLKKVSSAQTEAFCDMGNITIEFVGNPEDYAISSDVDMGDISLDGYHHADTHHATHKANLKCEMGTIDVTFTGNDR